MWSSYGGLEEEEGEDERGEFIKARYFTWIRKHLRVISVLARDTDVAIFNFVDNPIRIRRDATAPHN